MITKEEFKKGIDEISISRESLAAGKRKLYEINRVVLGKSPNKKKFGVEEAIIELLPLILESLNNGFSILDISAYLMGLGLPVTPYKLKLFLAEKRLLPTGYVDFLHVSTELPQIDQPV